MLPQILPRLLPVCKPSMTYIMNEILQYMYITLINKETIFYNLVCISKVERHDKLAQIPAQSTLQVFHDGRALSNTYVSTCMNICNICPSPLRFHIPTKHHSQQPQASLQYLNIVISTGFMSFYVQIYEYKHDGATLSHSDSPVTFCFSVVCVRVVW